MARPIGRLGLATSYGLRQGPRMAWYLAHGYAMGRLRALAEESGPEATRRRPASVRTSGRMPGRERLWRDLGNLLARDLANVEAGIYPLPDDHDGTLPDRLARSAAFFSDLPAIFRRRNSAAHQEVFTDERRGRFPRYYLQNFHYQSGGYLSEESARIYDLQVEVLFNGTANAMRRQVLVPIWEALGGRDQRTMTLADIACGTGRFLRAAKDAFPAIRATGIDLSEPYIAEARRHLRRCRHVRLAVANAEALPLKTSSQDVVTTIYLFHELPPKVRRTVAAEFARVLKPGGLLVFMDSLQIGDVDDYDGLLERFPHGFHEPYYDSFIREDLGTLFAGAGFSPLSQETAFVSKVMAFRRH